MTLTPTEQAFLRKVAENAEDPDLPFAAEPDKEKQKPKKRISAAAKRRRIRLEYTAKMKTASIGPSAHRQFDESFATIAYTYLQQSVPMLIDHLVGFQVLDRTDNGRAVGAFVFNPGGKKIQAPVFFIDGELKGHQLLRLVDEGIFVPARESVVRVILQRAQKGLGVAQEPQLNQALADPSTANYDGGMSTLGKAGNVLENLQGYWDRLSPRARLSLLAAAPGALIGGTAGAMKADDEDPNGSAIAGALSGAATGGMIGATGGLLASHLEPGFDQMSASADVVRGMQGLVSSASPFKLPGPQE